MRKVHGLWCAGGIGREAWRYHGRQGLQRVHDWMLKREPMP